MVESSSWQTPWLEWAVSTRRLVGEADSGDRCLVAPLPNGVLVAVVDGLGHGDEAAAVSEIAVATLREHACGSVLRLLQQCHAALQGTRGVVISLAAINAENSTLSWAGVGDVEGVVVRADAAASRPREYVSLRGGVVGYRLPKMNETVIPLMPGDTLIFATDGIRRSFTEESLAHGSPQQLADHILRQHGKQTDDALALVARYLGGAS
jgi:phosphoserine phosphatase RsbX